jgi:hypothetical protein
MITMPNGSGQRIGTSSARAGEQVLLASAADLADEADPPAIDVRLDVTLEEAPLPGLDHTGEDKVLPGGAGDLNRAMGPFSGVIRPIHSR